MKIDPSPPETDRWRYLKTLQRNNDVARLFVEAITETLKVYIYGIKGSTNREKYIDENRTHRGTVEDL